MEEKRRRASSNYKQYAKKYKEASRKSQKIEEKRIGGRNTRSLNTDETTSNSKESDAPSVVKQKVIFEPNPGPQTRFLALQSKKSYMEEQQVVGSRFMVADPVRYFTNPHARMLLVRRSTEELRELISVSKQLYPKPFQE